MSAWLFWSFGFLAAALDQLTKYALYSKITDSREIIPGVLYFLHDANTGVVWGMLRQWPAAVFVIDILAVAFVVYYYHVYSRHLGAESLAWGLILGGAVGNLIDRATGQHAVKDFISVRIHGWAWPTFNLADTFIAVGAFVVVLYVLFSKSQEKTSK